MESKTQKRGFTVLELLVVIGILGVLAGVLTKSLFGSSDSAQHAKCLANMHNLAAACHSVGMAEGHYPAAGSSEYRVRQRQNRGKGDREHYYETCGWISWYSKGAYQPPKDGGTRYATAHKASSSWFISAYSDEQEKWYYCLTNGAIWRAVNANESAYICPFHPACAKKNKCQPRWSYVMNEYFGADDSEGARWHSSGGRKGFTSVKKPERRLLFAELPFNEANTSVTAPYKATAGTDCDPTLQYSRSGSSYNEVIGFNHQSKRKWYAHVCFADGHTEKLEMPSGMSLTQQRELTKWLCEGQDITYTGKKYEEVKE